MPCGSKITPQSFEVTAVGMAHGIRMTARTMARPRNALFMTSAKPMPMMVSSTTVTNAKNSVISTELQNSAPSRPGGQCCVPPVVVGHCSSSQYL